MTTDTTNPTPGFPTPEQLEDRAMATKIQLVARHLSSLLAEAHQKGLMVRVQLVEPATTGSQDRDLPQRIELVSVARVVTPLVAPLPAGSPGAASADAQQVGAVD